MYLCTQTRATVEDEFEKGLITLSPYFSHDIEIFAILFDQNSRFRAKVRPFT